MNNKCYTMRALNSYSFTVVNLLRSSKSLVVCVLERCLKFVRHQVSSDVFSHL